MHIDKLFLNDKNYFLVMEQGADSDLLTDYMALPQIHEQDICRKIKKLLTVLKRLHSGDMIHGNVTPQNIQFFGKQLKLSGFDNVTVTKGHNSAAPQAFDL